MNPFQRHGIKHLSPSSLNLFIAQPGIWALRYLGRQREAGNVKMWRGSAVESGFVAYLRTGDLEQANEAAARAYWLNVDENNARGEAAGKEAELLQPMLEQCLKWNPPSELNAAQIKVEHFFDDVPVPVMGYLDLAFEGSDVDLKTTAALPSKPRPDHVRQVSLYRAARGRAGGLLYVTAKKHAYYEVTDEMMAPAIAELSEAAVKMSKLLGAFDKAEDIVSVLPIDYSDFRAPQRGALGGRPSAADEFTAVELET